MKKLSLFATALSLFLLVGCATSDMTGSGMDDTETGMQTEKSMDKDMGHMDDGTMGMDKGMDEDKGMKNDMNNTHDMNGM